MSSNTPITFPPFAPSLKLPKRSTEPSTPSAPPMRTEPELEPLSERERMLFEHEQRLHALQAEIEALRGTTLSTPDAAAGGTASTFHRPGTHAPFQTEVAVQTAWDQIRRARALLEAEQNNLRDQRISLQAFEAELKRREATLAGREQAVAEREARAANPAPAGDLKTSVTRSPFSIARSVFGAKQGG